MADLMTLAQFKSRLGATAAALVDDDEVEAKLADASALVRQAAGTALDDVDHTTPTPDVIMPVVYSATYRAIHNPAGDGGEMLDGWRREQSKTEGVFLTRDEKAVVRSHTGAGSIGSVQIRSDLPIPSTEFPIPPGIPYAVVDES